MQLEYVILLLFQLNPIFCIPEVESLKRIIERNINKAKQYEFPKDNKEFFSNISYRSTAEDFGVYDFIIIGGGSAGAVIASRLSEVRHWKVLLLEAGGNEDDFTDIPDMMFWSLFSEKNWGYYSTPQETCCQGMVEKRCFFPRGKILGGTGSVNALMYARGNAKDFDHWKNLGNEGWSYEEVLPYFKKSEKYSIPNQESYHGYNGPVNIEYAQSESKFYEIFTQANEELGINQSDYNGKNQFGYSKIQFHMMGGRRISSAKAFISSLRDRTNLKISTRSFVTKINLNDDFDEAKGVEFMKNGKKYVATARNEVIVSAGSINSPQLLMLSGIGPKDDLENLGIKVRKNLPVGKFLKDHINFFGLRFRMNISEARRTHEEILEEFLKGKGDLTIAANDVAIGFHKTNDSLDVPDIEYILVPPSKNPYGAPTAKIFNADPQLRQYLNQMNSSNDITIFMIFLHPKSQGSVRLQSKDPSDFPLIDLGFFSDENGEDLKSMVKGIEFIMRLIRTESFQKLNPKLIKGIKDCDESSKDYWNCALRNLATSSYHPVSTTRMGRSEDDSVVDSNLRVHGIKNLRVADCGVFPSTTSGHPHAVAMMIGEKISDIIKKEYGVK